MDKITIIVVDDHAVFREGLRRILDNEEDMHCVATAGSAKQAIEMANELSPDIALIDISMPDIDGLETASQIKSTCPRTAVVILSAYKNRSYVVSALKAGVDGYLLKGMDPGDLLHSLRMIRKGEGVFALEATKEVMHELATLKGQREVAHGNLHDRELEILRLVATGQTNKEIGQVLNLSSHTVRTHTDNIFSKLGVKSRTEAVIYALKEGLISTDSITLPKIDKREIAQPRTSVRLKKR